MVANEAARRPNTPIDSRSMRVGVIDVGANTVRLLVVEQTAQGSRIVNEQKARLSLGADVEANGSLSSESIKQTTERVRAYARLARKLGVSNLDVLITSPGRQAQNGSELASALSKASRTRARILSSEMEGQLAYHAAISTTEPLAGRTFVCDVGGGSTQLVVGEDEKVIWQRSIDIGSLRLTRRFELARAAANSNVVAAISEIQRLLEPVRMPVVAQAYATGGTAKALGRICGGEMTGLALEQTITRISALSPSKLSSVYPIGCWRAERLLAGTLILSELQRCARVPLKVASSGIREGAAIKMLECLAAA
jgi:exopolyphosphatase/guanosine-5'-triphosphate,3'-diphosphate pyrophosphatase